MFEGFDLITSITEVGCSNLKKLDDLRIKLTPGVDPTKLFSLQNKHFFAFKLGRFIGYAFLKII
jgi:hypothetical protein